MALKWIEGFELFDNVEDIFYKYPNSTLSTTDSGFITGTTAYGKALSFGGTSLSLGTLSNYATYFIGFAFKSISLSAVSFGTLLEVRDSTTTQLSLLYNPATQKFRVTGSGGGSWTVDQSTGNAYSSTNWHYIELKVTSNNSGSVILKINGTEEVNTSQNTNNSGNNRINNFTFLRTGLTNRFGIDDLYILDDIDSGGPSNNNFLGSVKVEGLLPSMDGNSVGWNLSNRALSRVDNVSLITKSQFLFTNSLDNKDLFNCGKLKTTNVSPTIYGTMANLFCRNPDATNHTVAMVYRAKDVSTETDTSALTVPNTTITCLTNLYEKDPVHGAGSQWTVDNLHNKSEFGFKLKS